MIKDPGGDRKRTMFAVTAVCLCGRKNRLPLNSVYRKIIPRCRVCGRPLHELTDETRNKVSKKTIVPHDKYTIMNCRGCGKKLSMRNRLVGFCFACLATKKPE